jgi:hypothetical protein
VISVLRTGHDNSDRNVSLVIHDVGHERLLSGSAFAYEHTHLVVCNFTRVKLTKL